MEISEDKSRFFIWELIRAGFILGELRRVTLTTDRLQLGTGALGVSAGIQEIHGLFSRLELEQSDQMSSEWFPELIEPVFRDDSGSQQFDADLFASNIEDLILLVEVEANNRSIFVLPSDPKIEELLTDPRPRFGLDRIHPIDLGDYRDMYGAIRCFALGQYEATAYFGLRTCERFVQSCYRHLTGDEPNPRPSSWQQLIDILGEASPLAETLKPLKEERNSVMHPMDDAEAPRWTRATADGLLDRVATAIRLMMNEVDQATILKSS